MKFISVVLTIIIISLLSACQSNNTAVISPKEADFLYVDQQFASSSLISIESEQVIFKLDAEMLALVEGKLSTSQSHKVKARRLLEHIFSQDNIALSYQSHANVTAREAFHSATANCLSLTIMAYALANAADLKVSFQRVEVPEYWIRNGHYNLLIGHVNLLISGRKKPEIQVIYGNDDITIDFDPHIIKQSFSKKIITKNTVLAMFYNNKGGQALVAKDYPLAYRYLKAATKNDPLFSSAWGNLAVLYKLTNNIEVAELTYRHAIAVNGNNFTALANLAILLRNKNETGEAEIIEQGLHNKRNKNPYYHAVLGDEAYHRGDYNRALNHYKSALKLNKKVHEFYFGLAKVYYRLDNPALARRMMRKAIRFNKIKSTESRYVAKLNYLLAKK